ETVSTGTVETVSTGSTGGGTSETVSTGTVETVSTGSTGAGTSETVSTGTVETVSTGSGSTQGTGGGASCVSSGTTASGHSPRSSARSSAGAIHVTASSRCASGYAAESCSSGRAGGRSTRGTCHRGGSPPAKCGTLRNAAHSIAATRSQPSAIAPTIAYAPTSLNASAAASPSRYSASRRNRGPGRLVIRRRVAEARRCRAPRAPRRASASARR